MEATRSRFGSVLEWLLAAGAILAVLAAGSMVSREFRTLDALPAVMANAPRAQPRPTTPSPLLSGAVSVPMLLFADGHDIWVGDDAAAVADRLGAGARIHAEALEAGSGGERVIRFYSYAGTRFALVLDQPDGSSALQVARIYLQ